MPKWKAVAIVNVLLIIAVVSLLTPAIRTTGTGAIPPTQACEYSEKCLTGVVPTGIAETVETEVGAFNSDFAHKEVACSRVFLRYRGDTSYIKPNGEYMTRDEIDVIEKRIYKDHPECRLDSNAWWVTQWDEGRRLMESAEQIKRIEATPVASQDPGVASALDEQQKHLKITYDKWHAEIASRPATSTPPRFETVPDPERALDDISRFVRHNVHALGGRAH